MYKSKFTVVTCVLVVFVMLAIARHTLVSLIPPVTNELLAESQQKFLANAGHQEIDWKTVEDEPFDEARKSNKAILLAIGLSPGKLGQSFELRAFEDPETARFVARNFYCIRIDGYEHPAWLNALLPISRLKAGVIPSLQIWTLDSNGHVLSYIGRTYFNGQLDANGIYNALKASRDQFDSIFANPASKLAPVQDMQAGDLAVLSTHVGSAWPSLAAYAEELGTVCDAKNGGFPRGDLQELYPNAWRFLTLTGYKNLWHASLAPILVSRLVDVQDGGFFRLSWARDLSRIEFDKGTAQNAEMMSDLAIQGQIEHDAFQIDLAGATFDWLADSAKLNGRFAACQEDDESPQGRSPRISFPVWRLRNLLNPADRSWVTEYLGLNPFNNSQMSPYFTSRASLVDNRATFDRIIGLMRASSPSPPEFNDDGYLDVNGHAIARMLEVARLWDDTDRLDSLMPLVDGLSRYKQGPDLAHWVRGEDHLQGYLGDYLGFCDARLQEYLATGHVDALKDGLHYLNLARSLFQGARPGQFNLCRTADDMGGFESLCVPEIVDNVNESCTAQIIRLELAYGRLTADTPEGEEMLRVAHQTTALFADIASRGGAATAGYFCAAAEVLDGVYAVAVGPNAQADADDLYQQVPTRFVAPALGSFRRDLQAKKPGIYIVGNGIQGPFSADEAAKRLPLSLVAHTGQ